MDLAELRLATAGLARMVGLHCANEPPPGVPRAAAPEQRAGRAEAEWTRGPAEKHRSDAQDDWLLESAIGE